MATVFAGSHAFHRLMHYVTLASLAMLCLWRAIPAHALPIFARQTGQNCVACHAGGQFPELTPYGRMFKLTGYTAGERTIPLAFMGTADFTKTRNNKDVNGNPISPKDGNFVWDAASIFLGGKITDKIGAFAQYTYTNYDHQNGDGKWIGHWGSDNTDFRFADRFIGAANDVILGLTVHNNPTVQDVWNTAPAWSYPYISSPVSNVASPQFLPLIEGGLAQQVVGTGAYLYWNKLLYAELTAYSTADGIWSFLSKGNKPGDPNHPQTYLRGYNPYWRLALTHEWGPHNVMFGTFGLIANVYPNDGDSIPIFAQGVTRYRDVGLDAQYQYLLEPHTITAQARYIKENVGDAQNFVFGDSQSANLGSLRLKASYIYQAKYGVSLSFFNVTGSADSVTYASSANIHPNTQGWMPELFWIPYQYVRIGVQYTHFTKYLGSKANYDGTGRNASDNDTLFFYLWAAIW
ncbi:hypothetical protein B0G57_101617 [Trinickia symbiotica]|uniref:Cytochrome C n=1 Tax=Trinickia symbiotica TaxID=863227 RepID=A0A2N7X1V2_9BURK|nr:hypothetical protein [Trinickia symbiotica]PMS35594.1 cytochrome C [Trinickia symbiotica]PPK47649.1 hypothetical protein B0G57_101617 [Trinickia symbiotica]